MNKNEVFFPYYEDIIYLGYSRFTTGKYGESGCFRCDSRFAPGIGYPPERRKKK